jgi:pimeloyl-ACP methyl ester carboxylesterase
VSVPLLHGFPTSSHLYRNILPTLAKTHRAIALDLPGYGLSDKPLDSRYNFRFYTDTLNAFRDALDISTTNLVVHDLGGPVGMYWAVHNPHRVNDIVLLNTLVYPETSWAVKLFLLALRTPGLRDFVVSPKGIVGAMKFGVVHKERLNREVLTPYTAPFEAPAARKALIKAGSGLSIKGLAEIARKLPSASSTAKTTTSFPTSPKPCNASNTTAPTPSSPRSQAAGTFCRKMNRSGWGG